jgi:hypothetical protein
MDKLIAGKMSFDLQPIKLDELLAECDASHQGFCSASWRSPTAFQLPRPAGAG